MSLPLGRQMVGQVIAREAILEISTARAEAPLDTVEELVAQHTAMLFRIAYSVLRNHHDAEDAVQECFLRVLKYGKDLQQVRNPKTWLARIMWTVALDRRSSRNMVSLQDDSLGPDLTERLANPGITLDEWVAGQQLQQLLERLVAGLPEDLRYPLQ